MQRQEGCLRFCYLSSASLTPRRYRCQPDLALEKLQEELKKSSVEHKELPAPITAISIDSNSNKIFVGTAGNGIFYLEDLYLTNKWVQIEKLANKQANKYINCVLATNNTIFAGSTNGEIFRYTENDKLLGRRAEKR
ncbi:MAG: hypothetical protein HC908_16445 [Calothrix sp. SM1_7_51]|nr:hypothetical protein [Calothrix sp. SM1_7_51]